MEQEEKKYLFVVNPVAGKGKSKALVPRIEAECQKRSWKYEILYTKEKESVTSQLKEIHNTVIYAVGGDGLISQVLQAIVGTDNQLAVLPAGSGNDFYKTISHLEDGEHQIDVGKINNQYFGNVACLGIDAEVANNIDKLRDSKIPTSQLYNASIVYTFFKYHPKKVDFKTGIKEIQAEPMIISICNGAFYGGGYKIAPKSSLTDGIFDVYYADKFHKFHMLSLLPKLRKGNHEGKRYIHKFRTNHVEITTEEEVVFNVDGEKLKGKHFVLEVVPKAITLLTDQNFVEAVCKEKQMKQEKGKIEEDNEQEVVEKGKFARWKQKWRESKAGKFLKRNSRNIILVMLIFYMLHLMMFAFMGNHRFKNIFFTGPQFIEQIMNAEIPFVMKVNDVWLILLVMFVSLLGGTYLYISMGMLFGLFAILRGITGNTKASCVGILTFTFIFEILNYVVTQLRGTGITLADVYSIQTAINVADGGMNVSFNAFFLAGIFLAIVVGVLILALKKSEKKSTIWRSHRICAYRLYRYGITWKC